MTPYLIAISGGSGSGKSTLAKSLFAVLGPELCVHMGDDNYDKTRKAQGVVGLSAPEVEARVNFDDIASKDLDEMCRHVEKLKAGKVINQPVYDFAAHDRVEGKYTPITPKQVTLVEGIHVLSTPELAGLFDLKIFVDTPDDLRLARRIIRDTAPEAEGGRGRDVKRVISQYLNFVRPTHYRVTEPAKYSADLVIADEGLPAFADASPSRAARMRMLSPVLSWLLQEGIVQESDIAALPD